MSNQYTRGSEWRRWDLHVHTPSTKKNDCFSGSTEEEKWDNFYQSISDYIGDGTDPLKSVCAIGITDYLSIENYLKVRDDGRLPTSVKLVLPNVELRATPIANNSALNIHCIFNPDIVDQLDARFFGRLKIEYDGNEYGATSADLVRLGRAFRGDQTLDEEVALQAGLEQYVIPHNMLSDIFKGNQDLRDNTIIIVSNKSTDGASGVTRHSEYLEGDISILDATRRGIYQFSDMIFSSNSSDIDYFLGNGSDDKGTVKSKCGALMPCVHGSDAHTNDKIFKPDQNRFCWIKADPTFEGLKQVLYEPKERVRISATYPEEKQGYHIIDRVEIVDNEDFDPQPIYFSDNLTCIIGGKSTGKSLLLHNMALAIAPKQVELKEKEAPTNVKQVSQLKIYWRDGACSDGQDGTHKVVYSRVEKHRLVTFLW